MCNLQFCWHSSDFLKGLSTSAVLGSGMVHRDVQISLKTNTITTAKIDRTVNDTKSKIPMLLIAVDPFPGPGSPGAGPNINVLLHAPLVYASHIHFVGVSSTHR